MKRTSRPDFASVRSGLVGGGFDANGRADAVNTGLSRSGAPGCADTFDASVLMAVYDGTPEAFLRESLSSLAHQTQPCPVVLVVDGPVTWDMDRLAADFGSLSIRTVRLPENNGLASALNAGLETIETRFVFRMDADDVAAPQRFARLIAYADEHDSRFLCSWHKEFGERSETKKTPTTPGSLHRRLMWHNIVSHPSVMVETALLRTAGGYRHSAGRMEDYDLYLRLRAMQVRFDCVGEPLVFVRTDGQSKRRAGLSYLRAEANLRRMWHREGLLPPTVNVLSFLAHTGFRVAPSGFRALLFRGVRFFGR